MAEKTSRSPLRLASSRRESAATRGNAAVLALKPDASAAPRPTIRERWEDAVATVTVRGDLDREALWGIDYTIHRASSEAGRIVLDLREVTHVDYAGVADLVARRRELHGRGGDLLVVVRNPYVANILRAGAGAELSLFRSVEEATGAAASVATVVAQKRSR